MQKSGIIVRYTAKEIRSGLAGPDQTDWAAFDAVTEEELEASIDVVEEGLPIWSTARAGLGPFRPKKQLTVRYDPEVIEWFMAQGKGYQARMNFVLRNYVEDQLVLEKDKEKQS